VRAAVDFHWRNKNYSRALDILERSAAISNASLKTQFTFEAAQKATEAAQYARARKLLEGLLKDDPYKAEYLSAMADTWAREGNERELTGFYNAKLTELRSASLASDEKTARSAGLRRGFIPVLTRVKDYTGAVDQYIELINRYPEDGTLVSEAAQYAAVHGLKDRLLASYSKTAAASPKDYRWQLVLARLYSQYEDFDNAIASYSKAIAIRPDRVDLYSSRASLEERLMRFDDAAATCTKLYDLTYRNPVWMAKVAEIRARQRRTADVTKSLERAYIEGRPPRATNFFTVAGKLEEWDFLPEARAYAEKGIDLAG
jgi:tetratricopeptide (TPR) repeat protein